MKNKNYLALAASAITISTMALGFAVAPLVYAEDGTHIGTQLNIEHQDQERDNENNQGMNDMNRAVVGTVSAVNGSTITITTKGDEDKAPMTFTVNAANATVLKKNVKVNVSNIAVGDMLVIKGTITGNSIVATSIRDNMPMKGAKGDEMNPLIPGNGQPIVAGKVTAISGSTITITNSSNVTYTVDATNAKIQKGNALSTISNVVIGDMVVVQGTVNNSSITATSIIDQGVAMNSNDHGNKGKGKGFFASIGAFFSHLFGF